jgi:hypothetical protein
MITLLLNSEIGTKGGNEIKTINYICDSELFNFESDSRKINFAEFVLKINRKENGELQNLQIELKNLSAAKILEVCCTFGQNNYSEDFLKSNKMFLRLTLNEQLTEKYKFLSIDKPEELFNIKSNGENIFLNLNNYSLKSFRLIEF